MAPSQLKIKSSALNRLLKDISLYKMELQEQKDQIEALKNRKDQDEELEYELRNQNRILLETEKLIPSLQEKAKAFEKDLREYIETNKDTISEEELSEANKVLESVEKS